MGYERNDRFGRDNRGYDRGYGRERGYGQDRDDERGFFDRAGDEVRSWFGDEEAERRRRMDERYDERYDRDRYAGGETGGYRRPDAYPSFQRSNRDEGYADRSRPPSANYSGVRYDRSYEGRQFDDGGYAQDARGYTGSDYGARFGSSDRDRDYRATYRSGGGDRGQSYADDHGDYRSWRDRQVSAFDRDYEEFRRENRQRFESEFATWRTNRQAQRDQLGQVKEHQEVLGSDGTHVGTVDHVRGDHILLTKNDRDAGGHHHSIPCSWVTTVADKVTLNKTAEEAKREWRDAEERGGLFGGERDQADTSRTGQRDYNRSSSGN